MRNSLAAIALLGLVMSCADAPTQPASLTANAASASALDRPGATLLGQPEVGWNTNFPEIGRCTFRVDESGEFNNFVRVNPDGSRFAKIQDASGQITVTPLGGQTWAGAGRLSVNWPSYPSGDNIEVTIVGSVSVGGQTAKAVCKDRIVNGVRVEAFIKLN